MYEYLKPLTLITNQHSNHRTEKFKICPSPDLVEYGCGSCLVSEDHLLGWVWQVTVRKGRIHDCGTL